MRVLQLDNSLTRHTIVMLNISANQRLDQSNCRKFEFAEESTVKGRISLTNQMQSDLFLHNQIKSLANNDLVSQLIDQLA